MVFPKPPNEAYPRKISLTLTTEFLDNFSFPYDRGDCKHEEGDLDVKVDIGSGRGKKEGGKREENGENGGKGEETWGAQSYGAKQTFGHICGIIRRKEEVMTMFSSFGYVRQKGLMDVALGYLEEGTDSDACVTSCKALDLFIKAVKKGSIGEGGVKGDRKLINRTLKKLTLLRDETEFMTLRGMVVRLLFDNRLLSEESTKLRGVKYAEEALRWRPRREEREETRSTLCSGSLCIEAAVDTTIETTETAGGEGLKKWMGGDVGGGVYGELTLWSGAGGEGYGTGLGVSAGSAKDAPGWMKYPQMRDDFYFRR